MAVVMPIFSRPSASVLSWTVYLITVYWMAALVANLQRFDTLASVVVMIISAAVAFAVGLVILHGLRKSDSISRYTDVELMDPTGFCCDECYGRAMLNEWNRGILEGV